MVVYQLYITTRPWEELIKEEYLATMLDKKRAQEVCLLLNSVLKKGYHCGYSKLKIRKSFI